MNKLPSWCVFASLIVQNKKEHIINLHRLQAGSWASPARAQQMEADILWAYADSEAIPMYHHAAQLYRQEQDVYGALQVYEQLLGLSPSDYELHLQIIMSALELGDEVRVTHHWMALQRAVESEKITEGQFLQLQQQLVKRCAILERQGGELAANIRHHLFGYAEDSHEGD